MITIETMRLGRTTWTLVAGEKALRSLIGQQVNPELLPGAGRGRIGRLALEGERYGIFRRLYHGGWMRFLGAVFAGSSRPLREFFLLLRARERGAPVPQALAAGTERFWGFFYRGELVTEEIPAQTLGQILAERAPEDFKPLLRLLLDLHRSGVEHTDLNLHNILVPNDGSPWVAIDLDGGRLHEVLDLENRLASLLRLDRSYQKHFGVDGPVSWQRRYRIWHHYLRQIGLPPSSLLGYLRRERNRRRWHHFLWRLGR